jgi:putative addiction module CopG family antidote
VKQESLCTNLTPDGQSALLSGDRIDITVHGKHFVILSREQYERGFWSSSMSVDLAPDVWDEIQRQLASGSFASTDEVLREALTALRSREEEVYAIQEGIEDMEAGRVMPLRQFDREFRQRNALPAAE